MGFRLIPRMEMVSLGLPFELDGATPAWFFTASEYS
jgi:hypothetical protein